MHAIEVAETGGPEVLTYVEKTQPSPGPGEVLIKAEAIGVNFLDTYFRSGKYPREVPFIIGNEVAGTVEAMGDDVAALSVGDRVVTAQANGAYADYALAPADFCAYVPDSVSADAAAAALLKGMTAHYLIKSTYPVQEGDAVLVHAGAGGVGSAAVQLGVASGARVIATAGSEEKRAFCRTLGAELALDSRSGEFAGALLEATQGAGVDVVCDLVGGATTLATLPAMARGGRLVMAGFSGDIAAEDTPLVTPRAILFGNFSLGGVMLAYRDGATKLGAVNLLPRALGDSIQAELLRLLGARRIRPIVGRVAPYTELPAELERLESRATLGRSVLDWR